MKTTLSLLALLALALSVRPACAADLVERTWKVGGVERKALVHLPAKIEGAPVIFAFHGHYGTMRNAARTWHLEREWPEAIVVYAQGVPTKTPNDRVGSGNGWSLFPGSIAPNPDLKFFDAMLATARTEWKVDPKRVFCTGHSNGAAFTYLLWGRYPDTFAALAPVAGAGQYLIRGGTPCPLLAIGAENDPIVKWETQQLPTIEAARKLNGTKAPVEVVKHSRGHAYPADAPEKIVAFFKKHTL